MSLSPILTDEEFLSKVNAGPPTLNLTDEALKGAMRLGLTLATPFAWCGQGVMIRGFGLPLLAAEFHPRRLCESGEGEGEGGRSGEEGGGRKLSRKSLHTSRKLCGSTFVTYK